MNTISGGEFEEVSVIKAFEIFLQECYPNVWDEVMNAKKYGQKNFQAPPPSKPLQIPLNFNGEKDIAFMDAKVMKLMWEEEMDHVMAQLIINRRYGLVGVTRQQAEQESYEEKFYPPKDINQLTRHEEIEELRKQGHGLKDVMNLVNQKYGPGDFASSSRGREKGRGMR